LAVFLPLLFISLHWTENLMLPPARTSYGWVSEWNHSSVLPYFYYAYYIGCILAGVFMMAVASHNTTSTNLKKQAGITITSSLLVLFVGTYFEVIMPALKLPGYNTALADITNVYILLWAGGAFYSILKYNLYSVSTATAADNVIAHMSEALFLMDDELKMVYANAAAHKMLGYPDGALSGRYFGFLLKNRGDLNKILRESLRNRYFSGFETGLQRHSGGSIPVLLSMNTLTEEDDVKGFAVIATDITDRKVAEFKIKSERDRAQKYLDTADVVFLVLDKYRRVSLINKKGCVLLGRDERDINGRDWVMEFVPEEYRSDTADIISRLMKDRAIIGDVEGYVLAKNGARRLIRWSNSVIKSDSGEVTGLLCAGIDITEQAEAEQELKKMSVAVDQSPVSIVITDLLGNITYANSFFEQATGYSREEALGKNPRLLKSGDMPGEKYEEMWKTISSGSTWHGIFHNRKKSGELFWESASISPVKDYKNEIQNYIAVKEDITQQKKAEEELKASYEKLKELDMMKTSFTSMVSHELRTPLTSIKGFLSLLLSGVAGKLTPTQKEFLESVNNNSERLLSLINDILDVSKMEAGSFSIDKKPCNIEEIVKTSIRDMRSIADRKNIRFELKAKTSLLPLNADSYRITQVITNLLNNALKFSPEGSVISVVLSHVPPGSAALPAHIEKIDIPGDCLAVSVADQGIGIKKEHLPKIFTRFYQVENIHTRHAQGTGLGLSIAKNIVEAHGGRIWVDSGGEGKGTVFTFIVPAV
jgi:PAS domain S-box-containing protein